MIMRRVVITGLGVITPVGNDVPTMWAAMLDGRSGVRPITRFDPTGFETQFAAEIKDFDPSVWINHKEVRRMDRFTHFAVAASAQAIADSGLHVTPENSQRIGVAIGSGIGGIGTILEEVEVLREKGPRRVSPFLVPKMLSDSAAGQVAIHFGLRGPNMSIVSACATGSNALGEAGEMIRRGAADVMLAGGAEAGLVPVAVAAFNAMGAISRRNDAPTKASRPFDAGRDGFVIGEGSGVLVLESLEHAQARGARIYAELVGYGATADAYHATAPEPSGDGAAAAMQMALDQFQLDPSQIGYLNAHGTSTSLNDKTETLAIKQVFGSHAYRLPISSTKSMIGHMLGAAGAVEAIVCVKALQEGILPPTINYETPDPECDLDYVPNTARQLAIQTAMSNSFGFGGHNACVILRKMG
ncbi:MAG: beta-ketoacyl-ACP synthase II [Thermoflexales bacterium]|nr:beta-ketoacyl-ACP synthase II [Thermoflexales bacterium]